MCNAIRTSALAAAVLFAACSDSTGPQTGEASVLLVQEASAGTSQAPLAPRLSLVGDVPADAVSALNLVLTRIDLHRVGTGDDDTGDTGDPDADAPDNSAGWISIDLELVAPVDLLALPEAGGLEVGAGLVPVGTYNAVRLFIESADLTLSQDVTMPNSDVLVAGDYPVDIPSVQNTGLKILTGRFEVNADELTSVILEVSNEDTIFSLEYVNGDLRMLPVVKVH